MSIYVKIEYIDTDVYLPTHARAHTHTYAYVHTYCVLFFVAISVRVNWDRNSAKFNQRFEFNDKKRVKIERKMTTSHILFFLFFFFFVFDIKRWMEISRSTRLEKLYPEIYGWWGWFRENEKTGSLESLETPISISRFTARRIRDGARVFYPRAMAWESTREM